MTLEQKQSLFQQNSTTLVQLEQQKAQTKERLQLSELQLETLNSQLEEQTEALTAIEHTASEAEQSFASLQSQQRQAQQQFEQVKAQVENNSNKNANVCSNRAIRQKCSAH